MYSMTSGIACQGNPTSPSAMGVVAQRRAPVQLPLLLLPLLLGLSSAAPPLGGAPLSGAAEATTVGDVYGLMYREQARSGGAYLLLNATGGAGSAGAADRDADAPLIHLARLEGAAAPSGGPWAVLAPAAAADAFLARLASEPALQQRVKAVLVDDTEPPASCSSLPPFPGAEFAPYPPGGYVWNPFSGAGGAGGGMAALRWPVPVMRLRDGLARDARERADFNAEQGHRGRAYHARVKLPMSASDDANSTACLASDTCRPLGGYSVWAALPPIPAGAKVTKPTLLVVAQVDSIDLFHDSIQGADAPLSGLVALLAAADILGAAPPARSRAYARQIVFLALAGEPWGYMGSKAFLWELERGGAAVEGLDLSLIDQVLEIGPIGRALSGDPQAARLFAHTQRGAAFGDAAPLLDALAAAAEGLPPELKTEVAPASSSNPGIPPSSLTSFLRVKPSIAGAVLTEFDRRFTNPYHGSRFDNGSRVDGRAMARGAALVAAAVHALAGGRPGDLQINATAIEEAAAALTSCLIAPDPGLSCGAASEVMLAGWSEEGGVRSYAAKHYVGVLQVLITDPQSPYYKDDVPRFIWNRLALAAAGGVGAARRAACDPSKNKCPAGQACVGWKQGDSDPALLGACLNATARYVPALSTRVTCEACDDIYGSFKWVVTNASDGWAAAAGWPRDPMWAESNWPLGAPFVQLYLAEPYSTRVAVLVAGSLATAATFVASLAARRKFEHHLKNS
ncbi:MAG: Nicastrin-domain-containing protein [Monoraphidium minutum]|nr:MAG: Nicastrin-domain-containing protein [Monoraphidium minutum]